MQIDRIWFSAESAIELGGKCGKNGIELNVLTEQFLARLSDRNAVLVAFSCWCKCRISVDKWKHFTEQRTQEMTYLSLNKLNACSGEKAKGHESTTSHFLEDAIWDRRPRRQKQLVELKTASSMLLSKGTPFSTGKFCFAVGNTDPVVANNWKPHERCGCPVGSPLKFAAFRFVQNIFVFLEMSELCIK